jgi:hypothetical protein
MSQFVDGNHKTFIADEAIAIHLRVKLDSDGRVTVAGSSDRDNGTAVTPSFAAGEPISVRLQTAAGTRKMVAAGAVTAGGYVYAAASGKVSAVANGNIEGVAQESATTDGDIIEVQSVNVPDPNSITLADANGAIALVPGTVVITKTGSLAAMTLAAPTVAQNGLRITVTSATAFAHTITATALIDNGVTGGSKTTATFAAFAGASITLMAYAGKWHVISANVVSVA